jgi:CheY-like chemotaxis protein
MTKPHILIVDDDELIVDALTTYLEFTGCRVTSAGGCRGAMEQLRKPGKVDLVILDYVMPDGFGTDLLKSLGEDPMIQKPPVIMSSGILDPRAPVWEELKKHLPPVSQALIHAYVSKPYTFDAMDVAMHEVLGGDYIPESRASRKSRLAR